MNFYRHYLGDYGRKTAHLSLMENGAYRLLLDHYYATGRPLPADIESLCRICRAQTDGERKVIKAVADQFFPVNGDGTRHNKRADQELGEYEQQVTHNRRVGVLGGRPRSNPDDNPDDNPEITRVVSGTEPGPNPLQKLEVRSQKLEVRSYKPERRSKAQPQPPAAALPELPAWLDKDAFTAWMQGRPAKTRKPAAQAAAIAKLDKFRQQGHDPNAIVRDSLANGWQGIFVPDAKRGGVSLSERNDQAVVEGKRLIRAQRTTEKDITNE